MKNFIPKRPQKMVVSILISIEMVDMLNAIATKTHMSRNELLNQCIRYAVENIYPSAQ